MDTFDFPYHVLSVEYPQSSVKLNFGQGYEFASKPKGPDQLDLILDFQLMMFYEDIPGEIDLTTNPRINMGLLEKFYQEKRLFQKFIYPHQFWGDVVVRFKDPLKYKVKLGGMGSVEPFSVRLTTQP